MPDSPPPQGKTLGDLLLAGFPRFTKPRDGVTRELYQSRLPLAGLPRKFYFGGHFHFSPGRTGRGWMYFGVSRGDYYLLVYFEPTIPGYRESPLEVPWLPGGAEVTAGYVNITPISDATFSM